MEQCTEGLQREGRRVNDPPEYSVPERAFISASKERISLSQATVPWVKRKFQSAVEMVKRDDDLAGSVGVGRA